MENLLNKEIDWKIDETDRMVVRRFVFPDGRCYTEYTSKARIGGWPLFHMTLGRNPETGRRKAARGIVAIGRIAIGGLAIGQLALGILPIGQLAIGLVAALGQGAFAGLWSIGQIAAAYEFAAGQFAAAQTAVGQFAFGTYALGQFAKGQYACSIKACDPAVLDHLREMFPWLLSKLR